MRTHHNYLAKRIFRKKSDFTYGWLEEETFAANKDCS